MNAATDAAAQFLDRFVAWAHSRPDIRAAILVGSLARRDRPADEWSDVDLILVVTDPSRFVERDDWLAPLGTPRLTFLEPTAMGNVVERRVLFDGGLDVDFVPLPLTAVRQMARSGPPPEVAELFRRGMRFVLDRDGLEARLRRPSKGGPPPGPPAAREFRNVVDDFWYHAVWTAKKLRRGELWTAMFCLDDYMKWRLLRMMEWHARAVGNPGLDTWHAGRFLEQWADPEAQAGLRASFAHYDADDLRRALFATMDLFRRLSLEVAARWGYACPHASDEYAEALVRQYLPEAMGDPEPR